MWLVQMDMPERLPRYLCSFVASLSAHKTASLAGSDYNVHPLTKPLHLSPAVN